MSINIIFLYLRKPSKFRIPENLSVPLIMIGPGTGVSPFIGFLEHRRRQLINDLTETVNTLDFKQTNYLFFGCRYRGRDDIYNGVLTEYEKENLCQYLVCYSREEEKDGNRFVQDLLRERQKVIVNHILTTDANLFICGDGRTMGSEVLKALTECFQNVKGISEDNAKKLVAELETCGRISKDVWI